MEIKGPEVIFTPSEANWAQNAAMYAKVPSLAQRILDARVAYAQSQGDAFEIPPIGLARGDSVARATFEKSIEALHKATVRRATYKDGQEAHVVAVSLDPYEKLGVLLLAHADNNAARQQLETPEIHAVEVGVMRDDLALYVAISDFMEQDEAVVVGDLLRDPELHAAYEREEQENALREVAITARIITALEADLVL